jgi:hypothetical protein
MKPKQLNCSVLVPAALLLVMGCSDPSSPAGEPGTLNVIVGAAQAQEVSIAVDGEVRAQTCYPCSSVLQLATGSHSISIVRLDNSSIATEVEIDMGSAERHDMVVYDSGATIAALAVLNENGSEDVPTRFHVIHSGFTLGTVDVYVTPTGQPLAGLTPAVAGLDFGEVWYAPISPAAPHVRFTVAGTQTVLAQEFLANGKTIALLGAPGEAFAIP